MRRPSRTLLTAAATVLVLSACGTDDPVEPDDAGTEVPPVEDEPDDADDVADDADDTDGTDEPADDAAADDATTGEEDGTDGGTDEPADDGTDEPADDGATDGEASGPEPDADLVADPCGPHGDEVDGLLLDVVSPVPGQQVGDDVELVGCANAFEANVRWTLQGADGTELDTGFVTAECGGPCVGAFSEVIDISAATDDAAPVLVVYLPDESDGEADVEFPEVAIELARP